MSSTTLPFDVYPHLKDRTSRHIVRIAEQMSPDPSKWSFHEIRMDAGGVCACGRGILHQRVLKHQDNDSEIIIGSSCIERTVPWLVSMGASDLAEAIQTEWKKLIAEIRAADTRKRGMKKLIEILPMAAALDVWLLNLHERTQQRINKFILPPHFRKIVAGWHLTRSGGNTPGRRASSIQRRIRYFMDGVPLIEEALKNYHIFEVCYVQPPEHAKASDEWYSLFEQADELRSNIDAKECVVSSEDTEYHFLITHFLRRAVPYDVQEMRTYVDDASKLLELLSDDELLLARKQAYDAQKRARTTFQSLIYRGDRSPVAQEFSVINVARIPQSPQECLSFVAHVEQLEQTQALLKEVRSELGKLQDEVRRCRLRELYPDLYHSLKPLVERDAYKLPVEDGELRALQLDISWAYVDFPEEQELAIALDQLAQQDALKRMIASLRSKLSEDERKITTTQQLINSYQEKLALFTSNKIFQRTFFFTTNHRTGERQLESKIGDYVYVLAYRDSFGFSDGCTLWCTIDRELYRSHSRVVLLVARYRGESQEELQTLIKKYVSQLADLKRECFETLNELAKLNGD